VSDGLVSLVDEVRPTEVDGWPDGVLVTAEPSDAGVRERRALDRESLFEPDRCPLLNMMTMFAKRREEWRGFGR
jgi:hypothetical protein